MYSIQGLSDTVIPEVDSLTWSLSIEKCCIPAGYDEKMRKSTTTHHGHSIWPLEQVVWLSMRSILPSSSK